MSPTMNVPLILYYYNNNSSTCSYKFNANNNFKRILEESLAEVLNDFYPFAGRYVKEERSVDCGDHGVEYLDAESNIELHQLLQMKKSDDVRVEEEEEQLNCLLPAEFSAADEFTDPLLSVQVTGFECGSVAIGVSISHRLADASTLSTFISAWANLTAGKERISPIFNSSSIFPGRKLPKFELGISRGQSINNVVGGIITKRFVFNRNCISNIRSKLMKDHHYQYNPTRVQLVSGLILRALLIVDQAKNNANSRASLILQTVNFRDKTVPPLPKHSCGNFCTFAKVQCSAEETINLGLEECVNLVTNALRKTIADCAKILNSGEEDEDGRTTVIIEPFKEILDILSNDAANDPRRINAILLSSWCRFPFYEADFGWGKPVWVSIARLPAGNSAVLIDTRDGDGIEAWISLDKKDMALFQQDHHINDSVV